MELRIVHEDAHLRVIDKPVGLVVHPAPGNWSGTLLNGLLALDPLAANLPRAGIVHRLDRDKQRLRRRWHAPFRHGDGRPAALDHGTERSKRQNTAPAMAHRSWQALMGIAGVSTRLIGRDPRNRLRMAVADLDTPFSARPPAHR